MWVRFPLYLGGSANKRSDLRDLGREAHKPYREALVGRPRVVCCRKSTHCRDSMWVHGTWAGNVRDGPASCVVEKVRIGAIIVLTIAQRASDNEDSQLCSNPLAPRES